MTEPLNLKGSASSIGILGEDLVVQWLQSTGWIVMVRRFSCRWGELDIVAQKKDTSTLAFIEVKTRSGKSWDTGGREAVARKKQGKLWRTAEIFLAQYPEIADYFCRFDVAIVCCQRLDKKLIGDTPGADFLASSQVAGYRLSIEEYIVAAFDSSIENY